MREEAESRADLAWSKEACMEEDQVNGSDEAFKASVKGRRKAAADGRKRRKKLSRPKKRCKAGLSTGGGKSLMVWRWPGSGATPATETTWPRKGTSAWAKRHLAGFMTNPKDSSLSRTKRRPSR